MLNTFAPPFKVVATHFIFGFLYLVGFFILFSANNFYDYEFKAFLHCFFAGFALNIIIGALYQLSSVIYEKAFISTKSVLIASILQNISLAIMIFALKNADFELLKYSILGVFFALAYFIILFLLSFRDFDNIAKTTIFTGVIFLAFGILAALLISFTLNGDLFLDYSLLLKLHIYFMLGFVLFICIGAGSVLLPMFALTHKHKNTLLWISFISFILGAFHIVFIYFSTFALAFWCLYIIYTRIRKAFDFWNLNVILASFGLILASVIFYLGDFRLALLVLISAAILPFIIGHIYKILPFLIWYHYIAKFVGIRKVPLLNDLVLSKVAFFTIILNLCLILALIFDYKYSSYIFLALMIGLFINVINFFRFVWGFK